jgi:succinoglycan biosynthesis protein ExoM
VSRQSEVELRLTIAVPTFRRPSALAGLLPCLLAQLDRLAEVNRSYGEVLVIDNDPDRSARPIVQAVPDDRLRYVVEPRPGLAAVRNRALQEARESQVAVFLDDDQVPTDTWLVSLAEVWMHTGAAAVAGPVTSVLPDTTDPWVRRGGFFDRSYRRLLRTGDRVQTVATTNLWLDLAAVRAYGLRFDERFGLSGGEDSLFTKSLSSRGAAIVWCAGAAVMEQVPPARLTRAWVCRRAMSNGNTTARVEIALAEGRAKRRRLRVTLAARSIARMGAGSVRFTTGLVARSAPRQGKAARTVLRGWGMLLGAVDYCYQEYERGGARWVYAPLHSAGREGPTPGAAGASR